MNRCRRCRLSAPLILVLADSGFQFGNLLVRRSELLLDFFYLLVNDLDPFSCTRVQIDGQECREEKKDQLADQTPVGRDQEVLDYIPYCRIDLWKLRINLLRRRRSGPVLQGRQKASERCPVPWTGTSGQRELDRVIKERADAGDRRRSRPTKRAGFLVEADPGSRNIRQPDCAALEVVPVPATAQRTRHAPRLYKFGLTRKLGRVDPGGNPAGRSAACRSPAAPARPSEPCRSSSGCSSGSGTQADSGASAPCDAVVGAVYRPFNCAEQSRQSAGTPAHYRPTAVPPGSGRRRPPFEAWRRSM